MRSGSVGPDVYERFKYLALCLVQRDNTVTLSRRIVMGGNKMSKAGGKWCRNLVSRRQYTFDEVELAYYRQA